MCPKYENIDTMTATLHHLHMSELLHHDDDVIDPDVTNGLFNNDFTIGVPQHPTTHTENTSQNHDIFLYIVRRKDMTVHHDLNSK